MIIDLPQAVDAAGNNHAREHAGARRRPTCAPTSAAFAPELLATEYGKEIWALYRGGDLHPEVELTGRFERSEKAVDLDSVVREIDDARLEEAARRRGCRRSSSGRG